MVVVGHLGGWSFALLVSLLVARHSLLIPEMLIQLLVLLSECLHVFIGVPQLRMLFTADGVYLKVLVLCLQSVDLLLECVKGGVSLRVLEPLLQVLDLTHQAHDGTFLFIFPFESPRWVAMTCFDLFFKPEDLLVSLQDVIP